MDGRPAHAFASPRLASSRLAAPASRGWLVGWLVPRSFFVANRYIEIFGEGGTYSVIEKARGSGAAPERAWRDARGQVVAGVAQAEARAREARWFFVSRTPCYWLAG